MDDLISRQAAIDKFEPWLKVEDYNEGERNVLKAVLYELRFLPTAEPRKGNWIGIDDEPCEVWECDKCGHIVECDGTLALPNYCENCGADMREESE